MYINPIQSGMLFEKVSDPGGGGYNPPPAYDLENYCINHHHIRHVHFTRCFTHVPVRIFAILTILQRFQNIK